MTSSPSILGSVSSRQLATVVAVVGVAVVATQLAGVWPRDVSITYELSPEIETLHVDYLQDGEAVASVRWAAQSAKAGVLRDTVRLQPGEYQIHITLYGPPDRVSTQSRPLRVPSEGSPRIQLKHETRRSE